MTFTITRMGVAGALFALAIFLVGMGLGTQFAETDYKYAEHILNVKGCNEVKP